MFKKENYGLKKFFSPIMSLGLLFLLFPTFSLYDLFPDFVGWILIYLALSEFSEFNEDIFALKKLTYYLCGISATRFIVGILMLEKLNSKATSDTNLFMLVVTAVSICEIICIVMYSKHLFNGLEYLAARNDGEASFGTITNARSITSFFLIARVVLTLIPELFPLFQLEAEIDIENYELFISIFELKNTTMLVCMMLSLIMGIYWFTQISQMFRNIRKNSTLMTRLGERYKSEIKDNTKYYVLTRTRLACSFIAAGCLMYLNLVVDFKYYMPHFVGTLLIYLGFLLIRKLYSSSLVKLLPIFALVQGVVYFYRFRFADYFSYGLSLAESYYEAPKEAKLTMAIVGVVFIWASLMVVLILYRELKRFCDEMTDKDATTLFFIPRLMSIISVVLSGAMIIYMPIRKYIVETEIIVTAVWLVLTFVLLSKVRNEVRYKIIMQ